MAKKGRIILVLFLIILLMILVAAGGAAFWGYQTNLPPSDLDPGETYFSIKRGESLYSIAQNLEDQNLIRNSDFLRLYSKYKKTSNQFKAGTFIILHGLDTLSVHDILVYGEQVKSTVIIPEGWTMRRIGQLLEDKDITLSDEFLAACYNLNLLSEYGIPAENFEGYLFPDTYNFPMNYPAEEIVRDMVDNFFSRVNEIYPEYKDLSPKDFHRKVIIASIVEREYRVEEEAPLIASVFYNRLRINIHLQSCATVTYIITDLQGKPHPDRLFNSDLEIDSGYNTYKYLGLPDGPISNPGLVSLKASFFPPRTKWYFFVVEDAEKGTHTFTTYLEDHIKAKWLNSRKNLKR